jgi:hypothetical protein
MTRRITSLLCALAALLPAALQAQSYPPAWKSTGTYAIGDLAQENGNVYRAIRAVTAPNLDPAKYYTYWELYDVRANTTLLIGPEETFPTLVLAWNYALNGRISPAVYLHFQISTGHGDLNETFTSGFSLDHPYGANISILGDSAAKINFTFSALGSNGFVIDNGHTIAALSNMTLTGNEGNDGLYAGNNANIGLITDLQFTGGFDVFLYAIQNATLVINANASYTNFTFSACTAVDGASVLFYQGLTLNGTLKGAGRGPLAQTNGTYGLQAVYGGQITASNANISNCAYGAFALEGSRMTLDRGVFQNNVADGIHAETQSQISAESANLSGNKTDDVHVSSASTVDATDATFTTSSVGTASYIFTST